MVLYLNSMHIRVVALPCMESRETKRRLNLKRLLELMELLDLTINHMQVAKCGRNNLQLVFTLVLVNYALVRLPS